MKMLSGYDVHLPLLNRLQGLVQQRSFYDQPDLGWVTGNYLDGAYIDHLLVLAKPYGVRRLIFDDAGSPIGGYFRWTRDVRENPALQNWLLEMAHRVRSAGLRFGLYISPIDREVPEHSEFLNFCESAGVELYDPISHPMLDGVGLSVGGGKLPYLRVNELIQDAHVQHSRHQPILIRIDQPGMPGEILAGWGNVFGLSYHLLTGQNDPNAVERFYADTCFNQGQPVKRIFDLAKTAIDKSFRTLNVFSMMDRSCWPGDLAWYDQQLDLMGEGHPLYAPNAAKVSEIDYEKIEALEAAHDAWQLLEQTGGAIGPQGFLWLEHHFLHLKTVCMVLRMLARGYFKLRGHQTGKMTVASHVFRSVHKELYETVGNKRTILGEFSAIETSPLAGILASLERKIEARDANS